LPTKPHLPSDGLRAELTAPMPGVIQAVQVKVGDELKHGQTVVVLEAMKMKNSIKSPRDGVIAEVLVQAGQSVGYGDVLVRFGEGQS
jgi:biotin carboxyl carrier protein